MGDRGIMKPKLFKYETIEKGIESLEQNLIFKPQYL